MQNMEFSDNFPDCPLLIRNKINNWKILKYNEDDWCNEFKDKVLIFRQGNKTYNESPYWEIFCEKKELTLKQFFKISAEKSDYWLYFDYKYMKDVFPAPSEICNDIKWVDLKVINFHGQDSTLWIGNEGAHTPCHMDAYGCNFVAQIFGRKLWILIPPEETKSLNAVRIPYEESSIYSSYNFYTPNHELLKIKNAHKIILSPGDVLYVPRHWWHYVENLEVAISVNVWVPLDVDHESRLEECLIRHFISNTCQDLSQEEALEILNPNECSLLTERFSYSLIHKCVENCIEYRRKRAKQNKAVDKKNIFGNEVERVQQCDLESYIRDKIKEHNYNPSLGKKSLDKLNSTVSIVKSLINAYGHPTNISVIKEALISQLEGA